MCGKWSARIVALAFINAKVFDVVALEVVHYSSLLLVYELSIAPLHAIAPDNLEKIFLCFFAGGFKPRPRDIYFSINLRKI